MPHKLCEDPDCPYEKPHPKHPPLEELDADDDGGDGTPAPGGGHP